MNDGKKVANFNEELVNLAKLSVERNRIDKELYGMYDVKQGLRDIKGKGVLAGLTNISNIVSYKTVDGQSVPCDGKLYYRGIDIEDIVSGFMKEGRFGFEETAYLLLFGKLPTTDQLEGFKGLLAANRTLPTNFVRDVVMKAPTKEIMNSLSRSVLTLYGYDALAEDISLPNVLRQCMNLISVFPMLSVYAYQAYSHYDMGDSFFIHNPDPEKTTAENILFMLRPDKSYTQFEAAILDLALVLHMEHGGGNNSSFTTHVLSSSGTDTYSVISAALGSLKGPKHGGANIKVMEMFKDLKEHVHDYKDKDAVEDYLVKLLHKEAFDKKGLIYGMGHAVYSISDPRASIFKSFVERLAKEKGREEEFELYSLVETMAPEVIARERRIYKGVSANVDFYSGFVYHMLDLPLELYTPMFACARIVGWSAHRLEELTNCDKIIRPAYKNVLDEQNYIPMQER